MRTLKNFVTLILFGWNINVVLACTDIQVLPANSKPHSSVTFTCTTDVEVKQIALEIIGEKWNGSFPNMYDDGSHGDIVSNDKVYSLAIDAPAITGSYQVMFFRILPDQTELQSKPFTFNVQ